LLELVGLVDDSLHLDLAGVEIIDGGRCEKSVPTLQAIKRENSRNM
tara:strand:+ start:526 stop:663 length:138 start_codon:yes stop_codon:yes gene_type:complete